MKKVIFEFTPRKSHKMSEKLAGLVTKNDFTGFIEENIGKSLTVTIEQTNLKSEKLRLFAYLNGPLMSTVAQAMTDAGNSTDKVEAMLTMKRMFAKDLDIDSDGNTSFIILHQSDMTLQRLYQFVKDIVLHLEIEYGVQAPDAEKYKNKIN
jgi:hypothetical protein